MPDLFLKKVGDAFVPDGDESIAVFDKVGQLKTVHAEIKQPRSLQHLKLYWSLCHRIANALDRDDIDAEAVSDFFKKSTGHYDVLHTKTQGDIVRLRSISFTKLDQIAFNEYFEKCVRFAVAEWGIPYDVFGDMLGEIWTEKRGG